MGTASAPAVVDVPLSASFPPASDSFSSTVSASSSSSSSSPAFLRVAVAEANWEAPPLLLLFSSLDSVARGEEEDFEEFDLFLAA